MNGCLTTPLSLLKSMTRFIFPEIEEVTSCVNFYTVQIKLNEFF